MEQHVAVTLLILKMHNFMSYSFPYICVWRFVQQVSCLLQTWQSYIPA